MSADYDGGTGSCPWCGGPTFTPGGLPLHSRGSGMCDACAHGPTTVPPLRPGEPAWWVLGPSPIGPWRREDQATSFRDLNLPGARVVGRDYFEALGAEAP